MAEKERPRDSKPYQTTVEERLESWKEIAVFLKRDVRTGAETRERREAPADFPLGVSVRPSPPQKLIVALNPLLRGWGEYYKRAHVRRLFQRLDGWIRRRIWSHRYRRWRKAGWKRLPVTKLYGEYGLVRLLDLIPSLASRPR